MEEKLCVFNENCPVFDPYCRMMITIGKYLPCLQSLDISNSLVTDRGIKLLAGSSSVSSPRLQPSPSVVRNLSNLLDTEPILIEYSGIKLVFILFNVFVLFYFSPKGLTDTNQPMVLFG